MIVSLNSNPIKCNEEGDIFENMYGVYSSEPQKPSFAQFNCDSNAIRVSFK